MRKIVECPKCHTKDPMMAVTLEFDYAGAHYIDDVPDFRIYYEVCLNCRHNLRRHKIKNTLRAVKSLRDEMDRIYGSSIVIPIWAGF